MTEELKPCPFCGSEGVRFITDIDKHGVYCAYGCKAGTAAQLSAVAAVAAVAAWNRRASNWIPLSERLPKELERVWIGWDDSAFTMASWHVGGAWLECRTKGLDQPTHWQPLPAAPGGDA